MSRADIEIDEEPKKWEYTTNKPAKVTNTKSGYTSSQTTTPNRPITITYGGKKVFDVYATVGNPDGVAAGLCKILNREKRVIMPI
jgi:hypothetical protein